MSLFGFTVIFTVEERICFHFKEERDKQGLHVKVAQERTIIG